MWWRASPLLAVCLLTACAMHRPATVQAREMLSVWKVIVPAGIAVYVITAGLIVWCVVAYRRREPGRRQSATPFHENMRVEATFIIIPILIVIGLFVRTYLTEAKVEAVAADPPQVVDVIGFRWSWRFVYPQHHVVVEGTAFSPPQLVLPLGQTVQINLTSTDVVHSFWVPAFMFKRDANPGYTNVFDLKPTRIGTYAGRCAEYCGTYHALMDFSVRVVSAADYARWLRSRGGTT
jgi:cytochrome c oxidase subunit 2